MLKKRSNQAKQRGCCPHGRQVSLCASLLRNIDFRFEFEISDAPSSSADFLWGCQIKLPINRFDGGINLPFDESSEADRTQTF
jgi:hypothetical protein